ncbi:MAG: glycosyltransferase family 4 protein [Desulfobulbus sp.]
MKIAIVHTNWSFGGGMEVYMRSLVKGFLRQGDDITVYACKADHRLAAAEGCELRQIKPVLPRKLREYRFLHLCNRLPLRDRYDFAVSLARTCSSHVAVCGGVHKETIRHIRRTALLRKVYDLFENAYEAESFQHTPWIMAHSRTIARQIRSHYSIDEKKLKVLYPPIDTEQFFPAEPAIRQATRQTLNIHPDRLTCLFVSCGHQCKGYEQLAQAFARLDPDRYELLVAGHDIPRNHPENIRYIGYINNLAPVYSAVDCTILPSHYEAFGLAIPESLQCGTPVITTVAAGAAELLTDREAVVLPDNQPTTLIRAIRQLERHWHIEPGFAQRHHLEIDQHITRLKALFAPAAPSLSR